ncbi:MAG: tRNA lysidine(34) synthetase TilS [Rhodothermales bacterium]
MPFLQRFIDFVAERALLAPGERVVVGVSGGLDSTVLLHLVRAAGFDPVAAHVNYGLRGAASDADEAFVREQAEAWGIPVHVHRVELGDGSVQAEAREARYRFFDELAREVGARAVATAHHRDDQAETLLLNLLRGAGPTGLAGMPHLRSLAPGSPADLVRPLLWATRAEIDVYAREHGLRWRDDATNATSDYRRNALRHEVLPLIETHFPGAAARIAHTADVLRDYLDSGAALAPDVLFDAAAEESEEGRGLRIDVLAAQPEVVRRGLLLEALRRWAPDAPRTTASVAELDALVDAQPGRRVAWAGVTVWRERDRIIFAPPHEPATFAVEVEPGETPTPTGTLRVELLDGVPAAFAASPLVEVVDADRLRFPLMLRPWRHGDVVRPLGLDGHKNVSDVLTEARVPPHRRAREPVLVSDGEIVWVVGHRLGSAFAVGPATRRAVRLTWLPSDSLAPDA